MAEKISVKEYIENKDLLELSYIPYDKKIDIVSGVFSGVIQALGGLNSTMLRVISTQTIIENVTNIDLKIQDDESGLQGFDYLVYTDELRTLINLMGKEYAEFMNIFDEYKSDYIRMETNPALTIQKIYEQASKYMSVIIEFLQEQIKNIDAEQFSSFVADIAKKQDFDKKLKEAQS